MLKRVVASQRQVADRVGYGDQRYDAVLDLFERGVTDRQAAALRGGARRRLGAIYTPADLIERDTGAPPNPDYFARYLSERYNWAYQLSGG